MNLNTLKLARIWGYSVLAIFLNSVKIANTIPWQLSCLILFKLRTRSLWRQSLISLIVTFSSFVISYGQQNAEQNEFKIGMFGFEYRLISGLPPLTLEVGGYNSSQLNVLAEDGFNVVTNYKPDYWSALEQMQNIIDLVSLNNMQLLTNTKDWYIANANNSGVLPNGDLYSTQPGANIYNSSTGSHPNFDLFFENLYALSGNSNVIWGHQICEESAFFNHHNFSNNAPEVSSGWPPLNFIETEIPLINVLDALDHFVVKRDQLGISHQKMIVMESNHSAAITSNLIFDYENMYPNNQYTAKNLLDQVTNDVVFLEGSYCRFPSNWIINHYSSIFGNGPNTRHYLGFAKSIDFARSKTWVVHDVIASKFEIPEYWNHFHAKENIQNANYMWFQAYTSIIHGASGIWFWDLNSSWQEGEKPLNWNSNPARFERSNFSVLYKNYISHLAKELRYLVNKNLLTTDESTIIATKLDFQDPNCIVPPAEDYLPLYLPTEKRTENYGLRYTIRSNGYETIMIVSNPLNVVVNATLDFSKCADPTIQSSNGVDVLFSNDVIPVTSNSYKVNRDSEINLEEGTVGEFYHLNFTSNKKLDLSFGPLDVKILKFSSNSISNDDDWELVWSNMGNGKLKEKMLKPEDLWYFGDFDGDGADEILTVQNSQQFNADWLSLYKYSGDDWDLLWSNEGSVEFSDEMYEYRHHFIVGDFDGDGKDELIGNDPDGWITMFKLVNGNWQWIWSNYGNSSHAVNPYRDKFYVGDFNGDGKDELLGCDFPNGWTTEFNWNGIDFLWGWSDYGSNHPIRNYRNNLIAGDFDGDSKTELLGLNSWVTLFNFDSGNWIWGWSNYGASDFNGWNYPLLNTDKILVGNLDLDTKEELFFLQAHSTAKWATTMDFESNQNGWNWNWSANPETNLPFIDDWPLASKDGNNTDYYLIKAKSLEPEYLLAMRSFCGNYLINMYRNSDLISNKLALNLEDNAFSDYENKSNFIIFPNPSEAKVYVLNEDSKIVSAEILSIGGQIVYQTDFEPQFRVELDLSHCPKGFYLLRVMNSASQISCHQLVISE